MHLFLAFVAFVVLGVDSGSGWNADSNVGRVWMLSKFFIRSNLLLKLLRTFSLVLKINPKLLSKYFFQLFLYLYENSLIQ